MKRRLKDITIGILIGCILTSTTPVLANTILQQINVVLNGVNVEINGEKLDSNSILHNGTTYLPLRKVAEAVGKEVKWDGETMTANIIEKADNIITFNNIETTEFKTSDGIPIKIINGKKYVDSENYWRKYNDEETKVIIHMLPDKKLITRDSTEPANLYINGEEVLTNIPYLNIDWTLYIEVDFYENEILPIIK